MPKLSKNYVFHVCSQVVTPKTHLIVHDTLTANLIQRVHHVEHLIVLRMKYFLRMSAWPSIRLTINPTQDLLVDLVTCNSWRKPVYLLTFLHFIVNVNICQPPNKRAPSVASSPLPVRSQRHGGLRQWRSRSCLGLPACLCGDARASNCMGSNLYKMYWIYGT